MAIVSISRFQSQPGQAGKHMELHLEALERLRGMGMQANAMQPIAGGDIGSLMMSVNYADNAAYVAAIQTMQSDAGWQEFYAGAMASGAAMQVESSLFSDLDPAHQPAADRPLGVVMATQWRALPGKMAAFVGKVMEANAHIERNGGRPRPMQSVVGAHPVTMLIPVGFADLDAFGAYGDTLNADAEWQEFWGAAMSDPTGEMVRSGIYVNMSG